MLPKGRNRRIRLVPDRVRSVGVLWKGNIMLINFLGDSITEGNGASELSKNYVSTVGRLLSVSVNNYGIGGTRIARQYSRSEFDFFDIDFNLRVDRLDESADIMVVFGGTNDFSTGDAPFGNIGDDTVDTFCGACHVLFSRLALKFKDKKRIVILPLHRWGEERTDLKQKVKGEARPLCDYREAIRTVAPCFGFTVLDLWNVDELNPNIEQYSKNFKDGLHPNDDGYAVLGKKIADFISSL